MRHRTIVKAGSTKTQSTQLLNSRNKPEDRLCRRMTAMIVLRITLNVLPEKQKEVVQTLLSLITPMQKEAGCLSYMLLYDMTDLNLLCVLQDWESREKLDNYLKSDIFGVLLGTKSLLCRPYGIQVYTVRKTEGMEAVIAMREIKKQIGTPT
jgi:quinol monooxygenase YgiN